MSMGRSDRAQQANLFGDDESPSKSARAGATPAPDASGASPGARRVAVAPAAPVDMAYDYLAGEDFIGPDGGAPIGAVVHVPFGGRTTLGVVVGDGDPALSEASAKAARLKPIAARIDAPPLRPETLTFLRRAAAYTLTPFGEMIRLATRAPDLAEPPKPKRVWRLSGAALTKSTPARERALSALREAAATAAGRLEGSTSELAALAGCSAAVIGALGADGALEQAEAPREAPYPPLDPDRPARALSEAQAAAAEALRTDVRAGGFRVTLLHGVTGSGKTEAYLEAVAEALRAGKQALVLLPEIALTEAFLARLEARFGARPAEWHSAARGSERRRCWRAAASGAPMVVVGARSALFLPFRKLGLIVVDEEHDGGYKQEEGAIYHARDMAVLRAQCEGAAVALASATPSLESWVNAGGAASPEDAPPGRYALVRLPARFGPAKPPEVAAVDMRAEPPERDRWIAPALARAINETLARGEQALLFLNRRGYAPLSLCRACGERLGCPHCESWLVLHRLADRVVCHLCGHNAKAPAACPSCGADALAPCGPGVERLAEEAAALWPDQRLSVISSDLAPSGAELRGRLAAVAAGEVDLIVGTQIVAKGHNFPDLTLVGVVDADLGLNGGDFRAAERTFQLLRQVAGRAGRSEKPGRALIQTAAPDHPVMRALCASDEEGFLRLEAEARRAAGAPPFGRYLAVIVTGPKEEPVWAVASALRRLAEPMRAAGGDVLGPAPAPIARIRGRHRVRLLVKAPRRAGLQAAAKTWLAAVDAEKIPGRGATRVVFDVDPQSFF